MSRGRKGQPVWVSDVPIGGCSRPVLMAGPCGVEDPEQIEACAAHALSESKLAVPSLALERDLADISQTWCSGRALFDKILINFRAFGV